MFEEPTHQDSYKHDASIAVGLAVIVCAGESAISAILAAISTSAKTSLDEYMRFGEIYLTTLVLSVTLTIAAVAAFYRPTILKTSLVPGHLMLAASSSPTAAML